MVNEEDIVGAERGEEEEEFDLLHELRPRDPDCTSVQNLR